MRAVSDGMTALLAGYQFAVADLYTITLSNGTVLRYTSGDGDIGMLPPTVLSTAYDGLIYHPTTLAESNTHYYVGLESGFGNPVAGSSGYYEVAKATGVATKLHASDIGDAIRCLLHANNALYVCGINTASGISGLFKIPDDGSTMTQVSGSYGSWRSFISIATDGEHLWALLSDTYNGLDVYCLNMDLSIVSSQRIKTIYGYSPMGSYAHHIYCDNGAVYVSLLAHGVYKIADNNASYALYALYGNYLAFTDTHIFSTSASTGTVTKINKATMAIEAVYSGFNTPDRVLFIADFAALAVSCNNAVAYVSVDDGAVIDSIAMTTPRQVIYSGGRLLIASFTDHKIVGLSTKVGHLGSAGKVWYADPFRIERGDINTSAGVDVDDCQVTFYCKQDTFIDGLTLQHLALIGRFDHARVSIDVAIMPSYGDVSNGLLNLFEGRITDVVIDNAKVEFTVSSDVVLLDMQIPTKVYQPTCVHSVYSSACGAAKASFSESAVVAGVTALGVSFTSARTGDYYFQGSITFTSGYNIGLSQTIRASSSSGGVMFVNFATSFPFVPEVGDSFVIAAGCDKLRATCRTKFSNEVHFLGWEYMPVPEASV